MSDLIDELRQYGNFRKALGGAIIFIEAADLIEQLQQRNAELAATVERLRGVVVNYHDENIAAEEAVNELWDIHKATPQQNLNAVKREAVKEAIHGVAHVVANEYDGSDITNQWNVGANHILRRFVVNIDKYLNTKYLSVKDGE